MIQQAFKNVEIDAEGKEDGLHLHVKLPFLICEANANRVLDEFEKSVRAFLKVIQQDEFWQ